MLRRTEPGKKPHAAAALDSGNGVRLLHDIETISKALAISKRNTSLKSITPPPHDHHRQRSVSAGKSVPDARSKPRASVREPPPLPQKEKKASSSSSSSSIWSWKPLKALSHIRHRRFDCRFTLHVHSIEGLNPAFNDLSLCVQWKRAGATVGASGARTRPAKVFQGVAEFEESMAHRCSVYGSRSGHHHSAKYESKQFVLFASVVGVPEIDLGKHRVDLTRLLPLTLEELEEENCSGEWSTSFKLSGKGRGAVFSVSFGFSVVKEGLVGSDGNKKGLVEVPVANRGRDVMASGRQRSLRRGGSLSGLEPVLKDEVLQPSRSVDDVKVLHEVLPASKSEASGVDGAEHVLKDGKYDERDLCFPGGGTKPQSEVFTLPDELLELQPSAAPESVKMEDEKGYEDPEFTPEPVKMDEKDPEDPEFTSKLNEEKDSDDPEFTVIEQGIEVADTDQMEDNDVDSVRREGADNEGNVASGEVDKEQDQQVLEEQVLSPSDDSPKENVLQEGESVIEELDSAFRGLSILESMGLDSPQAKMETPGPSNYTEVRSDYKTGRMSKSLSLDDVSESVANEFLSMLGIEHSPFTLSSDSDPESPRERLWKQFERDTLGTSGTELPKEDLWKQFEKVSLSPRDIESPRERLWRQFEKHSLSNNSKIFCPDIDSMEELDWGEDLDLTSIVQAAETEHELATQALISKTRAKLLEDAETEALMREWGMNEKAFQNSPPGSRVGFGSPIDLPPEDPLDLPPLGEGLGSFIQTKDGGFLRSMSPSLFNTAKNNGSLIMQVSSPVVVPAEMGSGIMDILQGLASIGIEKLSMQASKLMPLEDITGKSMQQVAWETAPSLEAKERSDFLQYLSSEGDLGVSGKTFGRKKRGKNRSMNSSRSEDANSEYVSIEDLAPLAMDKIEALSIEGLRIQSGMSDEEASSNISAQSFNEISALEGKGAKNGRSIGLEGAAGLQLLDVKNIDDEVDGLMGLSITLDEWMKLDSGVVDENDLNSDRTTKILAAHHANSADLISGGWKGDKRGGKGSGKKWGLLGNNFTVALMVQLRDPMRNYEPVGTPMLSLIQVERVFVPPKPKIYCTVSLSGNSEQYDEEPEKTPELKAEVKKEEEELVPQFKITEVHIAGLKTEPNKKKVWGNPMQQSSGSRWLLASGMGKSNNKPSFLKSKAVGKPSSSTTTVQPGDTLWSISSRVHGSGDKWKELAKLNPHIRNPNVIFPNQTIRLR